LDTVSTVRGSGWVAISITIAALHPSATADGTDCVQV